MIHKLWEISLLHHVFDFTENSDKIRMIEIMITRFVGQDISALQDFVIMFVTQFTLIQKLQLL